MRPRKIYLLALATSATATSLLSKRDLPVEHGCIPCEPNDAPHFQEAQDALDAIDAALLEEAQQASSSTWPAGYIPELCAAHAVNCVISAPGVRWTEVGGLSDPLGRWAREDMSEVIAWGYWQSTLQFVGTGGSGTTYNAHCTLFVCAKGTMRADIGEPGSQFAGSVVGDGIGSDDSVNNCGCFPDDLDADIVFSLFDPSAT